MITYIYHIIGRSKSQILEAIQEIGGEKFEEYDKKSAGWDFFALESFDALVGYGRDLLAIMGNKEDVRATKDGLEKRINMELIKI